MPAFMNSTTEVCCLRDGCCAGVCHQGTAHSLPWPIILLVVEHQQAGARCLQQVKQGVRQLLAVWGLHSQDVNGISLNSLWHNTPQQK
jgi:hypothetical protein